MRNLLLAAFAVVLCAGNCESRGDRKLVILHTNDEHSHLLGFSPEADDFPPPTAAGSGAIKGGVARRAVVLKTLRDQAAGADTLTVSAGDNMMGTLAQIAATTASPDYRLMAKLGYDVTTLGNHEFDYGPNGLADTIAAAQASGEKLPVIVASNTHFSGTSNSSQRSSMPRGCSTTSIPPSASRISRWPPALPPGVLWAGGRSNNKMPVPIK